MTLSTCPGGKEFRGRVEAKTAVATERMINKLDDFIFDRSRSAGDSFSPFGHRFYTVHPLIYSGML
jgi:hypothetical protein